jgi:hypothetical protein
MKSTERKTRVIRLTLRHSIRRPCAVCGEFSSPTHLDLDTGTYPGDCCATLAAWVDQTLQTLAPEIGWDSNSTWQNPLLTRRQQLAIHYRANKPVQLD